MPDKRKILPFPQTQISNPVRKGIWQKRVAQCQGQESEKIKELWVERQKNLQWIA